MTKLPSQTVFTQTNRSDILGDLTGSFNLDLTKILGKTRITRTIGTTLNLDSFPVGFKAFDEGLGAGNIWTVVGTKVYVAPGNTSPIPFAVFAADATTGTPTTCNSSFSDIETFAGKLYVTTYDSGGDKVYKRAAGGNWSANAQGLETQTGTHMLCAFGSTKMLISRGKNSIYSMDNADNITTDTSAGALALDPNYHVVFMKATNAYVFIGTIGLNTKGKVFAWTGTAGVSPLQYDLEAQGALAGVIKDDVLWIVDSNGRLLQLNGTTFVEKARFPIDDRLLQSATLTTGNNRFIHPNGMAVINGKINILIKNEVADAADGSGSTPEFCPSGIWEYDPDIGLYHKYSFSYTPVGANTITDYGQNRLYQAGGLAEMKLPSTSAAATGNFVAGAGFYSNASSTLGGTWTNDTFTPVSGTTGQYATQGGGYFVTSKIQAKEIVDAWNSVWLFYRKFLTSSDKILLKYRTEEASPIPITITWTSTTTFTTTTDVTGYIGYEFECLQGTGSGMMAHITNVSTATVGATTTYTVTLDDTFTGVTTGTAKGRIQNWTKFGSVQNQTTQFEQFTPYSLHSPWVQFKVHFLFTGPAEFSKMFVVNTPHQLVK